jgi:hypothetical protein
VTTFLVVLVLVVGFVIGQASMLRPSRRENTLMTLRAEARKMGLHARLLVPPEWYRGDRPVAGLLACYSQLTETGRILPYFRAEPLPDGEWVVRAGDKSVLAQLALPPEAKALLAIEAQGNAVSLWWQESLGVEALPALQTLLREFLTKIK